MNSDDIVERMLALPAATRLALLKKIEQLDKDLQSTSLHEEELEMVESTTLNIGADAKGSDASDSISSTIGGKRKAPLDPLVKLTNPQDSISR